MAKMYLVVYKIEGEVSASMKTVSEIIREIDMDDCCDYIEERKVYEITEDGPQLLEVHGCWHDFKNPLYIKLTRQNGEIVFDGYGTDH